LAITPLIETYGQDSVIIGSLIMQIQIQIALLISLFGAALASPQSSQEYLQHLVGQKLILRHVAGSSEPKIKEKDLSNLKGTCDEAVEVTTVAFEKSAVRLQLSNIGTPHVGNRSTSCSTTDVYLLTIVDFDFDQPPEQAAKVIGYVLQTPEAYLSSLGVSWNVASSPEKEPPAESARAGVIPGKIVLLVNPYYPAASRKDRIEGVVIVNCVMGTDGLVHDPVIAKGLSKELNKRAMEALAFYRGQPPYDGTHFFPVKIPVQFSFKLR
jgi:TonB family protein